MPRRSRLLRPRISHLRNLDSQKRIRLPLLLRARFGTSDGPAAPEMARTAGTQDQDERYGIFG